VEKARASEAEVGDEEAPTEARTGNDGSRNSDTDDASSNSVCAVTHSYMAYKAVDTSNGTLQHTFALQHTLQHTLQHIELWLTTQELLHYWHW